MNYLYKCVTEYTTNDYNRFLLELPSVDQEKINKLTSNKHKYERILSRVLLKELLNNNYQLDYNNLTIKYNSYGKPYIDNLYFSISHSHGYSLVATSKHKVGVDIEKIRKPNLKTIPLFCTPGEIKYIKNSVTFWSIYTLKEAYFKMLGEDLFNMKKVEFIINNETITCKNNPNLKIILSTEIDNYIYAIIYES